MSEIEKLYENAGFSKKQCKDYSCTVCEQYNECIKYPPFTAEKQIKLIKFLAGFLIHIKNIGGQINISIGDSYVSYYAENLSDAIALCINSKWKNLTSEEQKQIKEILNG